MPRILISAAEASGDLLAASLVSALGPDWEAFGLAGPAMRAAGVRALAPMEAVTAMGLVEVVGRLPAILRTRRLLQGAIDAAAREGDLAAVVLVDAPDLHQALGRRARSLGLLTVGYVSPQVWAWRPERVGAVAAAYDVLLCLFDFEPALYAAVAEAAGCAVHFVGHPLQDRVPARRPVDPQHFALLPASRPQELRRHLGPYLATAARLRAARPDARFSLRLPPGLSADLPAGVTRVEDLGALADCRAALSKSGTVTLEMAAMGVPQVVAHRVHPLTHAVGRRLVTGVQHIALPNILAGAEVVPEYRQTLDPDTLCAALLALPEAQPVPLAALGPPGASERAAALIRRRVQERSAGATSTRASL